MPVRRAARPKGRPTTTDHKIEVRLDEKSYQWLRVMNALTGESQSWIVRAVIDQLASRMNGYRNDEEED